MGSVSNVNGYREDMRFKHGVNRRITCVKDAGASKITVLVFGLIAAVVFYCGYEIIPFYYYFFELQNQFESVIKVASSDTDQEIRQKLNYHIRHMELPVGDDDELRQALKIERDHGRMKISLSYEEVFSISFRGKEYVIHRFPFHAYAEGKS